MKSSTPSLFTVTRQGPELVAPAKDTPRGLKPLSDIDDQEGFRFLASLILIYPGKEDVVIQNDLRDPVGVIREALAEALVYYYPLAGRLREGPRQKLEVDCTGEGVLFVEADATFTLEDLRGEGGFLKPPFPSELFPDVPAGSSDSLNCPLLHIQVTRFKCGGFSFAMQIYHTLCDAVGMVQFMNSVAELARGASQPSIPPVWNRELLLARDPPRVNFPHQEYHQVDGPVFPPQYTDDRIIQRSFFFGPTELSAIRLRLQPPLRRCSSFELLSAFLWCCRTFALRFDPNEEVRYMCMVSVRPKMKAPLPGGYYGNAFVLSMATSAASELSKNGLDYAVELIKKAKEEVSEEYMWSAMDFMATHGKRHFMLSGTWGASDNRHVGYLEIDFGWGKPEYGGPCSAMDGVVPGPLAVLVKGVNNVGESGAFLLICLPATAMERFAAEIERTTSGFAQSVTEVIFE